MEKTCKQEPFDTELAEGSLKQTILGDYYEGNKVWIEYDNDYILTEVVNKNQNGCVYVRNLTSIPRILCFSRSVKAYKQKPDFKPFDKVLVRDLDKSEWRPRLYSRKGNVGYCTQDGCEYMQILPYEGNEHLVGTTNKPE